MEGNIVNYITQIRGVSYKPSDLHDSLNKNSIILLRANNIDEGKINFEDVVYVDKSKVSETQILRENDILICASSGSKNLVGKAASFNGNIECTFGAFCKVIRPRNILGSYLSAFFQSKYYRFHISQFANGVNINNIKNEHINSFSIPERTLEEQKEISYKVFSLNRVIENYNRELELLDELVKARFVEMFGDENNSKGWEIVNIEDVANVQVGVVIKPSQYYTDQDSGIKAFRSLNIGNGYIKDDDWVYFSEEGNKKNKKSILSTNDVLIVRSGAPGTACVVTSEYAGSNAIDVIIAHPNFQKVDSHYLCTYTNMPHGKSQIIEGTGGAAQQHFNVGKYNKLKLMLPPLEYQKQYVKFLEEIDKSRSRIQKSLEASQELFDSLMQEYFG